MGRCQQRHPGKGRLLRRCQLVRSCQLIYRQHLRIHHPQHQAHPFGLGTARQDIGARAKLQRIFPLPLRCQLPTLVNYTDPQPPLTDASDQIP